MTRRTKLILIIGIILGLVFTLALFAFLRPKPEPTPVMEPAPAGNEPPSNLNDQERVLLIGGIVARGIGSFESHDPFFRNLLSVQPYITEDLNRKLQNIIAAGHDPNSADFEQVATVKKETVIRQTQLSADVSYELSLWRSDTEQTVTQIQELHLVNITGKWYVDSTTQIQ